MFSRRVFANAGAILIILVSAGMVQVTQAENSYPTKEVRIIVPFTAGGGTDLVTRLFAQELGQKYGQTFLVENRSGGIGGSIGGIALARSLPDGYTIGAGTSSGIQSAAIDGVQYNPLRDLVPIARLGHTKIVLTINSQLPANSVAELIQYAKLNPGMTYGSAGTGTANHFAGEMLAQAAGVQFRHIPYRGEGPALIDVLSGEIDFILGSLTQSKAHIESGVLKALAVTSEDRSPDLPDVPTMIESGYKDFVLDAWYGLYAPRGTPVEIIDALAHAVNEIRDDADISHKLQEQLSFDTSGNDSPEAFRRFMESELEKFRGIATVAGITTE